MEITINYRYRENDVKNIQLTNLIEDVLRQEECPDNTSVSINFISNEDIHYLNKTYRGVDSPTDVLSFECDGYDDEFDEQMGFISTSIEYPSEFNNDQAEIDDEYVEESFELGDIFIAVDIAESQSSDFGTSLENEICLLVVHGLLHIIGYDHMDSQEAEEMETREKEILDSYGYIRQNASV